MGKYRYCYTIIFAVNNCAKTAIDLNNKPVYIVCITQNYY